MRDFERDLRFQRDALLDISAQRLVLGGVGNLVEPAFAHHRAQRLRLGHRVGLSRARRRELRGHVGELLGGHGHAVGAGEQPRIGAERLDFRVGVGDLDAQFLDFLRQPGARRLRLVLLGVLLLGQIERGHDVGAVRGQRGVRADEFDLQHARLGDGKHVQAGEKRLDDAIFGRDRAAAAGEKRPRERQRIAGARRIEFGPIEQAELVDRLTREFRGGDRFGLTLNAFGIEDGAGIGGRLVGPGEIALLVLQQHFGDAGVARADRRHEERREEARGQRRADNPLLAEQHGAPQARQIDGFAADRLRAAVLESIAAHRSLQFPNATELPSFMGD